MIILWAKAVLWLFVFLGICIGLALYGDSKIEQVQSGAFFGLSLGCLLIFILSF
jgi:hypothetical protein